MIPPCVVVVDEFAEPLLQIARQIVVFKQDAVFHGAVPTLDLALRHRVIGLAACMLHTVFSQPGFKFSRDV